MRFLKQIRPLVICTLLACYFLYLIVPKKLGEGRKLSAHRTQYVKAETEQGRQGKVVPVLNQKPRHEDVPGID